MFESAKHRFKFSVGDVEKRPVGSTDRRKAADGDIAELKSSINGSEITDSLAEID
jgi:hypothetical protein